MLRRLHSSAWHPSVHALAVSEYLVCWMSFQAGSWEHPEFISKASTQIRPAPFLSFDYFFTHFDVLSRLDGSDFDRFAPHVQAQPEPFVRSSKLRLKFRLIFD